MGCIFGDVIFKQILYLLEYRYQLLHRCTVTGASNVLFIVASENTVIISALVTIYPGCQLIYLSLLDVVSDCSLKWAYESAWDDFSNPMQHLPTICNELISSCNYPINENSHFYCNCIWCILKGHVNTTQLPLPCAIQIALLIITKWNRCKGKLTKWCAFSMEWIFHFQKVCQSKC